MEHLGLWFSGCTTRDHGISTAGLIHLCQYVINRCTCNMFAEYRMFLAFCDSVEMDKWGEKIPWGSTTGKRCKMTSIRALYLDNPWLPAFFYSITFPRPYILYKISHRVSHHVRPSSRHWQIDLIWVYFKLLHVNNQEIQKEKKKDIHRYPNSLIGVEMLPF